VTLRPPGPLNVIIERRTLTKATRSVDRLEFDGGHGPVNAVLVVISNNWSDGGSSKKECNNLKEFDLNHVEYRNVRVSLAINAKVM
jgi:hypothetical protein